MKIYEIMPNAYLGDISSDRFWYMQSRLDVHRSMNYDTVIVISQTTVSPLVL